MDEKDDMDYNLTVNNPHNISENIVGEHLKDFDSCLVLAHFKGHTSGGFGGTIKQLSIGFASRAGKSFIHSGGYSRNYKECWAHRAQQIDFTSAMADAASTIVDYFKYKKGIAYINILANISTKCDCAGASAPEPKIRNIGILASLDPVAIDQACYDLIYNENTEGSEAWINQAERLLALNTLKVAEEEHHMGTRDYNLIEVDGEEPSSDGDTSETSSDSDTTKPDEDGKKNDLVLYIAVPVASVILIALIIFIIIKIKKKKEKDSNLLDDELGETVPE